MFSAHSLGLLALLSCEAAPPPPPTPSIPRCPAGMLGVGGGAAVLGRDDPDYFQDQLPARWHEVAPYCIEPLPFPGRAGDMWLEDGLDAEWVPELEAILHAHGRRLCAVEELVWAMAEGPANQPHLGGDVRAPCENAYGYLDLRPLGGWPDCVNGYGIRDAEVVSSWARSAPWVDDARTDHAARPYAVVGGTFREDTFYATTNFGLHGHGEGSGAFFDDQLRVCADPAWGGADDAGWLIFQEAAAQQGTFRGALHWFRRNGVSAAPVAVLDSPLVAPL